jgi:glycine/D-amino acid oxidase-like deaminating enzyme
MRIGIVGAGVIALLTAIDCVAAGHDVVLVDQGDIPFSGATSFDRHRVIRALHLGDPGATSAALHAHERWIELERLLSTGFYQQVGALTAVAPDDITGASTMLATAGATAQVLDPDDLAVRYPHIGFPAGVRAVLESRAGVLLADRVLAACVGWLRWHANAELHPRRPAVGVDVDSATVLLADGARVHADALLLAIGPWSRSLLPPDVADELVLHRQSTVYCDVPARDAPAWARTPAVSALGTPGGAWLVPPVAGTPLKLSAASACRTVAEVGDNTTAPHWRDHLVDSFAPLIPGFRADWLIDTRDCYYLARASTNGPMLATFGRTVLSYAACGGSSFKFAPLIARSLTERLTGGEPTPTGLGPLDVATQFATAR